MGMMQRKGRLAGLGLLVCAGALPLAASAGEGFYLGVEGGLNFLNPQDYKIYGYGGQFGISDGQTLNNVKFGTGWAIGLTTGYGFHNGLRPELELDYRRNAFSRLYRYPVGFYGGGTTDNVGGYENADTALANLWYDFFKDGWVHPYFGGGVGEARVAVRHAGYDGTQLNNDFDTVFAYQGGAGVGFDLGRHWTASLDYRHLETLVSSENLVTNQPNSHIQFNYRSNSILFGLRYSFGDDHAPAPPPPEAPVQVVPTEQPAPPPPAPCQSEPGQPVNLSGCKTGDTLVLHGVNFEFNKANLTVNAKTLLDQVADALLARKDIKVEIDGHTDGKGSGPYNMKLSDRRAASVKQYLVGRGIDADRMTTKGFGKTMPIADNNTDAGRELNRRVELKVTDSSPDAGAAPASAPAADTATPPAAEATTPPADTTAPAPAADSTAAPPATPQQ